MISAIAARKAAQAARQQESTSVDSQPSPSPSPLPIPNPKSPKRKATSNRTKPAKKSKRTHLKIEDDGLTSSNVSVTQDVILLESDEDVEMDAQSFSETSDVDMGAALIPKERAWSPSMPAKDSASEDSEDSGLIDLPTRFVRTAGGDFYGVISTYKPELDQNMFILSEDEAQALKLDQSEGKALVLLLNPGEILCLLGACKLTLLQGCIFMNGVPLRPSKLPHHVFAPSSSPLPILEAQSEGDKLVIDAHSLPKDSQNAARGDRTTLMLLQDLPTGIEGLGRICRPFDKAFKPLDWQDEILFPLPHMNSLCLVKRQSKDYVPFSLPETWSKALSTQSPNPVFLVKGPKRCGKSTFSRTLLNMLLTRYHRVAFLECDLGQSEFTPGGMVALNILDSPLFGPPYTHPTLPYRAHYIGSLTPRSSPSHYLDAIQNLVITYRIDLQCPAEEFKSDSRISDTIPLVVNTMGWVKGLGADLTQKVEEMVEPGQIFEFQVEDYVPSSSGATILEPAPAAVLPTKHTAADHRAISILSYFHCRFPSISPQQFEQISAQRWDSSVPLCAFPPYEIDIRVAIDQIILTGAGSEDVVAEELPRVLNGAIVGLVKSTAITTATKYPLPYSQQATPPIPSESCCVGLALIRAVDLPFIHLITPTPPSELSSVRILVKGEIELPIWGMLDFRSEEAVAGVEKNKVPYLQWGRNGEGALGAERRRIRRNLMRRGQA